MHFFSLSVESLISSEIVTFNKEYVPKEMTNKRSPFLTLPKRKNAVPPSCIPELSAMLTCWSSSGQQSSNCMSISAQFIACMKSATLAKKAIPKDLNRDLKKYGIPQLRIPRYNK
eukprot:NODE_231_length_13709_cov_0.444526.p10 type:complete len:115 gc:universal NODE_231_length_13709_cov_0.444526:12268-12612(+)